MVNVLQWPWIFLQHNKQRHTPSKFDVQGSVHRKCIFKYKQQDATLHNSFISARCSTCFKQFLCPSPGAQKLYIQHLVFVKQLLLLFTVVKGSSNCLINTRCCMYSFWAPDDGRRNRLTHVGRLAEINELCNVASCWLYLKIKNKTRGVAFVAMEQTDVSGVLSTHHQQYNILQ
jgi:hypothetical protein